MMMKKSIIIKFIFCCCWGGVEEGWGSAAELGQPTKKKKVSSYSLYIIVQAS